jgi:protein-L-isoaspartate(D-aspartate) O-methyltransferase
MDIEQARFNMIEQQIRPWDVLDPSVLALLGIVKREDFVPPEHQALAFVDTEVPLPEGQFMLSPKLEARLLQELSVHKHETVLLLGSHSSYLAALLGHKAQKVTVLDSHREVLRLAKASLARAGLGNVELREVPAAELPAGLPAEAPFDVIVLAGSVPSVPPALLSQLKAVSGRLIAIVGQEPVMQATLYTRNPQGKVHGTPLFDTTAPRLAGFKEPSRFQF